MTRGILLSLILGASFGCGSGSESGPVPFILPDAGDLGMLAPDMNRDRDVGMDAETLDATPEDQMLPDMLLMPQCSDGSDNDGDGQTDYPQDDGCFSPEDESEDDTPLQACEDGEDNDGDGKIDFEDPGCSGLDDPNELNVCGASELNFVDISGLSSVLGATEGDGVLNACRNNSAPELIFLYTIRDPIQGISFETAGSSFDTLLGVYRGCPSEAAPFACDDDRTTTDKSSKVFLETPEIGDYYIVVDGHGNAAGDVVLSIVTYLADGDVCNTDDVTVSCLEGRQCIDGICVPSACSNSQDDDGDGVTDYPNDPGCEQMTDDSEEDPPFPPQCADGQDNDFDGQTDFPLDANCQSAADTDESSPPVCSDGADNDSDGLIDLDDPGCRNDPTWFTESNPPACNNRTDDDEDGFTDFPTDPGCLYPSDNDETDPLTPSQCNDEIDNDEDGLTDYPDDTDSCFYAADDTEDDPCARILPVISDQTNRTRGTISDGQNDFAGSCGGANGNDQAFKYTVTSEQPLSDLVISAAESSFTPVVIVRSACGADSELACRIGGTINLGPQEPGTELWIIVDTLSPRTSTYRLDITAVVEPGGNCTNPHHVCPVGLTCQRQGGQYLCLTAACNDGFDNDMDGDIDYPNDRGCTSPDDIDEDNPLAAPVCSNGFDDDGDGLVDFGEDPQCSSAADGDERAECADGIDNDGDGRTDFDRDGDAVPDARRDLQCACESDPSEGINPHCSDGCDNDSDGLIDALDPGCEGPDDTSEVNVPQCADGIDNNGDGLVDYPNDPGCPNTDINLEQAPEVQPACSDGMDNDEDGLIDFGAGGASDDGCHSAADQDERPYCEHAVRDLPDDGMVEGNTFGMPNQATSTCMSGSSGGEHIYGFEIPYPARVSARVYDTTFAANLYLRSACSDQTPELGCRIFGRGSAGQLLASEQSGQMFLFVDSLAGQFGDYKVEVEVTYGRGDRCTGDARSYIKCEDGLACQFNLQRGFPICQ